MKIKYKLLAPVLISIIAVGIIFFLMVNYNMKKKFAEDQKQLFSAKKTEIENGLTRVGDMALSHAAIYTKMPGVIKAFQLAHKGDIQNPADTTVYKARVFLREQLKPIMTGFHNQVDNAKYKLHFHLPNGRSFLRVWRKTQSLNGRDDSDDISSFRQTVLDVNSGAHDPITGIEIGRGGFVVRGLAPVSDENGNHLGSVEMLYSFDRVVKDALTSEKQDLAVFMNREFLDIATSLQDEQAHPTIGNYIFVAAENRELATSLITPQLLDAGREGGSDIINVKEFSLEALPIYDYKAKQIGVMVFIQDISDVIASVHQLRRSFIVGIFTTVLLLSLLMLWITNQIVKPISILSKISDKIAKGDIDQEIAIDREDEIGMLANSFRSVIQSLKEKTDLANSIAAGNLDVKVNLISDNDALGKAMLLMKKSLQESKEQTDFALAEAQRKVDYLNTIASPVLVIDHESNIRFINQAGAKFKGVSEEDCIGKKCYDVFANSHCNTSNCAIRKAANNGNPASSETEIELDDCKVPVQYHGVPIKDEDGKVTEVVAQLVDLSEIKKVLSEINRTANELKQGNLSERAFVTDAKGDHKQLVEGFNAAVNNIIEPMNESLGCLAEIAKGDLTVYIDKEYAGDHAKMKDAMNNTLDVLNGILNQVNILASQVSGASRQVADASQSLSQGVTEQAASLQEISSSMTELGSQTQVNADNAEQANKLSITVRESAEEGNREMTRMLDAMEDIKNSSNEISKIIKAIDEIAFQTNLLALNAAVEAARAGVHGKGFAVVAEEVRNLAQRSARAAQDTTDLIEGSIKKIKDGGEIANTTAKALDSMVNGITKAADLVSEISHASQEQAQGIEQINQALTQIDQTTQANAANAEQSASASLQLNSYAGQLKKMLTRFRLAEDKIPSMENNPTEVADDLADDAGVNNRFEDRSGLDGYGAFENADVNRKRPEEIIALDDDDFGQF